MLYDSTYVRYLEQSELETRNRMVVSKDWGERGTESYGSVGTDGW